LGWIDNRLQLDRPGRASSQAVNTRRVALPIAKNLTGAPGD
jgi:hypothetical protein